MATAIEIRKLSKTFGKTKQALVGVSLKVEQGEMIALIGPSGSGKSTLIRNIAGLIEGNRGKGRSSIDVLGAPIQSDGRIAKNVRRRRARIGVIFQQFNLVPRLSLLTNVLVGSLGRIPFWRGCLGLFTREEKLRAMKALSRVDIAECAGQRASTLSGGQQQRAAIARALVQKAEVVLADEPIASLDPASSERVMENLSEINKQDGITVVVSLHQVKYAMRYCERAIGLRDGVVVYDGPSRELRVEFLQQLYGSESEEVFRSAEI